MQVMVFPSRYKKSLIEKRKNVTIRYGNEFGKYNKNRTYVAKSYAGKDWGIKVKTSEIIRTKIKNLTKFGINQSTITKLKKEHKGAVEIIRFKVV